MGAKIEGYDALLKTLQTYGNKVAKTAVRKATRAGTAVLRNAVKAETPVDQGVLKKLQDAKVKTRGFAAVGIVGANVDGLLQAHQDNPKRPTNIDWLVENGHVAPDGTFVPPSGYMRRASAAAMPEAEAKIISVMKGAIEAADTSDAD